MKIYKYMLPVDNSVEIQMPKGSQLLCVQLQHERPYLWALVDPSLPTITRKLAIYGTGHQVDDAPGNYVGTFQLHGGQLVFHVFDQGVR